MKKSFTLALFSSLVLGCFAAETIYRGDSTDKKDVICYYQSGNFYRDAARKEVLYAHPGNMVAKEAPKASPDNSIFRLQGNRIYKGFSINQADCLATLFETKTQRGNVLEAVIYKRRNAKPAGLRSSPNTRCSRMGNMCLARCFTPSKTTRYIAVRQPMPRTAC